MLLTSLSLPISTHLVHLLCHLPAISYISSARFANILWKHQLQVPSAVVLSTEDRIVLVEPVTRYLLGEGERGYRAPKSAAAAAASKGGGSDAESEGGLDEPNAMAVGTGGGGDGGDGSPLSGEAMEDAELPAHPDLASGLPGSGLLTSAIHRSSESNHVRRVVTLEEQSHGSFLYDEPARNVVLETIRDVQEWGCVEPAEEAAPRRRLSWSVLRPLTAWEEKPSAETEAPSEEVPRASRSRALVRQIARLWTPHGEGGARSAARECASQRVAVPSMTQNAREEEEEKKKAML